ncbi:hypothetical protein NEUTE1DRAFT_134059 [Neurospora tetrasperma FGSC 2508]|uniref:ER membrane protein complex subunit 6 n=1 Tax=Neurospora tetrasperma (strain FGSC 2508 / ATCC MYA-4615 / P0657) TaxID=510951 RepID=F8N026_NEUT8|nr:uncharacterized protein NEUTE1DRAFT_134059 [Neurospora tetrasperma FGSC 2508]EGO53761.1 hypothetical protein NEUTE1DRAFT_134059 [Neurospora tetrasperma FGSC 2508]
MLSERDFQISPIVQESVMHNSKALQNLQSLSASLFGISAGILGLESYSGFLFYLFFSLLTSFLIYLVRVAPLSSPKEYKDNKGTGNGLGSGGLVLSGWAEEGKGGGREGEKRRVEGWRWDVGDGRWDVVMCGKT